MSRKALFSAATALTSICASTVALADSDAESKDLSTVVVTASPLTQDPDFLATIVDKVNRDEILRKGGNNLADVLADVPGVSATTFAAGASRPVIRGFDANRVRTLEDGISSFDVSDVGPDHGVPLDPLSAQSVEVVRGAATLRYGSQAIGGVVNATNNRVPTRLPDEALSTEFTGAYGTDADTRQGSGLVDGRLGQVAIHADGFDRHTTNYDIPDGTQPNSFFKGDGYSFGSSYFFGDSRVGAGVVHYDATYGIPSDTTFIDMRQTKGMLRSSFDIGAGAFKTLTVDGGYGDYQHQEKDPDTGEVLSTFKDKEWDARAETLFDKMGPFTGTAIGVQVLHKDFSALGEGADYLLPTTTKSAAVFLFTEAPFTQALRLQAGARVEHVTIDGSPDVDVAVSRGFTPISASAGLVFDASKIVRLGLTLSSAARAPGQTELFAHGPHDGPATFETGDSGLRIERANSLESSIRVRTEQIRLDGSIWGAKFNHYIYGQLTGRTCEDEGTCVDNDSGELRELNYTQRDATFYGAEAKSTVGLYSGSSGKLEGLVLADYVRAKLSGGDNVPRIPPFHIGTGLNWTKGPLDAGFLVKYTARQSDVAFAETETAGFISLDAQMGWRPVTYQNVDVSVIGHNLTNSVQRNAVALNKEAVILPGRDVRLMARIAF